MNGLPPLNEPQDYLQQSSRSIIPPCTSLLHILKTTIYLHSECYLNGIHNSIYSIKTRSKPISRYSTSLSTMWKVMSCPKEVKNISKQKTSKRIYINLIIYFCPEQYKQSICREKRKAWHIKHDVLNNLHRTNTM